MPSTYVAVGGYMACSATMLISNKVAVHLVPAPSFIILSQLLGTVLVAKGAHMAGYIESMDKLELSKAKAFTPVALIFLATIYTNLKSLEYSNVETFMVFRFSTPLAISVADYCFLGRHLPSLRSLTTLFGLLIGAIGYVWTDSWFQVKGYMFCTAWYAIFCLDQVYLKHVSNTVKMESIWGRVYYSNLLAVIPLVLVVLGGNEIEVLRGGITADGLAALLVSVALGTAMSYFAWMARSMISATSFTIVGSVCKVVTIAVNIIIWDKHASGSGIMCLGFCLVAAYMYKQAPLRDDKNDKEIDKRLENGLQQLLRVSLVRSLVARIKRE